MTITLYVHLTIAIDKDKVDRGFKGNEQHEIEGIYGHEMQHAKMVEKVVAKMKGEWEPKFAIKEAKSYTEHDRCVKDMNQEIKEAVTDINNYITHVGFGHAGDKNNLMFVFLDRTKVGNVKTSGMGYPKEPGHGEDDAYPKNRYYEEGKGANEIETPSEDEEKRWLRIKVQ